MMGKGKDTRRNGQLVLTSERVCFYRKGLLGEVFKTIPLAKITSIETLWRMGHKVLTLHTSHYQPAFKTFKPKPIFDRPYDKIEELRHGTPAAAAPELAAPGAESIPDQIKKLGEIRNSWILTEENFRRKKSNF